MFQSSRPLTLKGKLGRLNWLMLALVVLLAGLGTATLYSVAGGSFEPWAQRHAIRCMAGIAVLVGCGCVPARVWQGAAAPIYLVALLLLIAVPFLGVEALGAKRWLSVGGLSIQPAEIMKVGLVLALASLYATLPPADVSKPVWVAVALALIAVPVALTLKQPDLGTALLFVGLGLGMMFLAGVSMGYFACGLLAALFLLPVAASHLHDYQRRRIETFLDPAADPQGAGYHITQAKIALGAGGWSGQGYLNGSQNRLDFVPEKMTDFIFVVIGEEWGFIGTSIVLALFAALIASVFAMALRTTGTFARLVIGGAALSLSIYVVINVAMVTGLIPVVGVPLPLISYGGTAMLTLMVALGLAESAHIHRGPVDRM